MATYSVTKSAHKTLTSTTVDTVNLMGAWDGVEVSNRGTVAIYVAWNGVTVTSAGDNTDIVEAGVTKLFSPAPRMAGDGPGDNTTAAHSLQIIGNGNAYSVTGVAGR